MKRAPYTRSLVFRLLLLTVAAALLPALFISLAARSIGSKALRASIAQSETELARRIAEEVNGSVEKAQQAVSLVARSASFSSGSQIDAFEALRNLMREVPDFQEAMWVGPSGKVLVKIGQQSGRAGLARRQEDLTRSLLGAPFFSGNRYPTILIGEPIPSYSNPSHLGAVLAKMSFTSLNELMRQADVGVHGVTFMVDSRGALLAHPNERLVLAHANFASRPVVQKWLAQPQQATDLHEYRDENGTAQISLAYPIPLLKSAIVIVQPKEDAFAPIVRMRDQFILFTSVSLAISILMAVAVGWRILQPLGQLRAAAEKIGRGGMDIHLNIRTGDELEELGTTFETMAKSLAGLERIRRDLISMIVHDLKMPLATILPSLESLQAGDLGALNAEQSYFVGMARRSGIEMLMLIQNLLDVARMEEGKLQLYKESFSPTSWAESVVSSFHPVAKAGKKRLELVFAKDLSIMQGDVSLLSRVLANLLSNALRHVFPETGEVVVSVYPKGNQLAVEVRDNGEGIPEEDQERIFEKFVQAERKPTQVRTGSGLGLTFCKMVVEAHGGRISVYSAPQEGCLFTFHLPITPSPMADAPAKLTAESLSGVA